MTYCLFVFTFLVVLLVFISYLYIFIRNNFLKKTFDGFEVLYLIGKIREILGIRSVL